MATSTVRQVPARAARQLRRPRPLRRDHLLRPLHLAPGASPTYIHNNNTMEQLGVAFDGLTRYSSSFLFQPTIIIPFPFISIPSSPSSTIISFHLHFIFTIIIIIIISFRLHLQHHFLPSSPSFPLYIHFIYRHLHHHHLNQGVLYCAWGGVGFALGWLYMAHGPEVRPLYYCYGCIDCLIDN